MPEGLTLEMLAKLVELTNAQRNQQIDTALKPRGQITQSPKNIQRSPGLAGWYELNPQARQGETYQQEQRRIRREQQVPAGKLPGPTAAPAGKLPGLTAAPAAKNQQGGSFTSWLSGLFGGGSQKAEAGPRINKLTGLPFGTMPGDPAYQDKLVQGAPKARVVMDLNAERASNAPIRDPQIQNAIDLELARRAFVAANPQVAKQAPAKPKQNAGLAGLLSSQLQIPAKADPTFAHAPAFSPAPVNPNSIYDRTTEWAMQNPLNPNSTLDRTKEWSMQNEGAPHQSGINTSAILQMLLGMGMPPVPPSINTFSQAAQIDPYVAAKERERQMQTRTGMFQPKYLPTL